MPRHTENLDGGLITNRDPALLSPGELSDIRNAVYRRNSPHIHRALGLTQFATASNASANVVGLRDIKFDNAEHYLVAVASNRMYFSDVGDTGDFSALATTIPGIPTQLEHAHFNNRFFLFTGVQTSATSNRPNTNQVAYLSSTGISSPANLSLRAHGMLPTLEGPNITTAAGTFSLTVTGFYEYWLTEVAEVSQDGNVLELEGGFVGSPTTVLVSATGVVPRIALPVQRNSATTRFRVYRSPKKTRSDDVQYPDGFMISDTKVPVTGESGTISDTLTTASASSLPSSFNSGGEVFAQWSNASNLTAVGGGSASASGALQVREQGVYNFAALSSIRGPVRGVEVEVGAHVSVAPGILGVRLGVNRRSNGDFPSGLFERASQQRRFASKSVLITATGTDQVVTLGSSTDRWVSETNKFGFLDNDFNSNFMSVISYGFSSETMFVDYVKLIVYYAATFSSVIQYPTVVYEFGDEAIQVSKKGSPPSASTGAVFQGSLVVNDVSAPALVRFSYPLEPESFPETYFIDFEETANDEVRLIKVVNSRLVVGLDSSIWRVNYLPSERDASFDRGKAKEAISRTYGVVNPMCATVFSADGSSEMLAFVSHKGIHITNGQSFHTITEDLDWRSLFPVGSTAIALIDNPEERELLFYFKNPDAAGEEDDQELHISYAPIHIKEGGRFKISGPVNRRRFSSAASASADVRSAWAVQRSNGNTSVYIGYGSRDNVANSSGAGAGAVFLVSGTALGAVDQKMQFTTRRMYLAGFGNEWKMSEMYAYLPSHSGGPSFRFTPKNVKTDDVNGEVTLGSTSVRTLAGEKMVHFPLRSFGEGVRYTMEVTGNHNDMSMAFFVVDGEDFGEEDSGL